jgi:hypothetical protein
MTNKEKIIEALENKKPIYKVTCEFYIRAEDEDEAGEIVADDMSYNNFLEEHILIEKASLPDGEVAFNEDEKVKDDNK